ncbi:MAG: hypothetical protein GY811_05210 [Myxococcales bacterium]|nr:hypothetical protein [Myxococcales bacterium]
MGLRELAETDLGVILEDSATGFGWPITVTDSDGVTKTLTGFSNDISQVIDPDTGQIISGRVATVALRVSTLVSAGLSLPQGIADATKKPWIIAFNDINGNECVFKVMQSNPDRSFGMLTCILELYQQ